MRYILLLIGCIVAITAAAQVTLTKEQYDSLVNETKLINAQAGKLSRDTRNLVERVEKYNEGDSIPPTPPDSVTWTPTAYNQNTFAYAGAGWVYNFNSTGLYLDDGSYSNVKGATVEQTCSECVGFEVWSEKLNTHGITTVSIDGAVKGTFDQYSKDRIPQVLLFQISDLPKGAHTIKLTVSGEKNPLSKDRYLVVDKIVVYETSTPPEPPDPIPGNKLVDQQNGNDAGNCDNEHPCKSVSRAASIAVDGDIIVIRAGTYRETITPASSGITFEGEPGAIISGLEPIANNAWSVHSGSIYKATVNNGPMFTEYATGYNVARLIYNNDQLLAQQLFRNSDMQFLAQWPKVSSPSNLLERSSQRGKNNTQSFTQTQITDTELGKLTNLSGGIVWINGWFLSYTRTINAHNGNQITFNQADGNIAFYKFYRVTNKLGLLTQAKEWHYENNTFYFWQEGGGSPTGVEYKKRNWGFNLQGKSNITIRGLRFIGCDPVIADVNSQSIVIDNIRAKYTNHSLLETKGGADGYHVSAVQTGIKLLGPNSIIKNSEFQFAAGMGVWLGSNTQLINCKFSDGCYNGQYSGFIKPAWGAGNIKIKNNTFTRSGRGAIELTPETNSRNINIEIGYNDFIKFNMLNVDGGPIYASRKVDLTGMRIHHNWFHNDGGYNEAGTGKQSGIQVNGVYFDQAGGPATIDHNIFWNGMIDGADIYNQITYEGRTCTGTVIYNNTFASVNSGSAFSYATYVTNPNDVQRNNIYKMDVLINWGADPGDVANSLRHTSNPMFRGGNPVSNSTTPISDPQNYFQLQSGSPALGIATAIAGINDGDNNGKDAGAYYFEQTAWIPGYIAVDTKTPVSYSLEITLLIIGIILLVLLIIIILRKRKG